MDKIDMLNRTYLWRIMADHINLLTFTPLEFLELVRDWLSIEHEQILPFILAKVSSIFTNDLANLADAGALESEKEKLSEVLLAKIKTADASARCILLDAYIQFAPSSKLDHLKHLATKETLSEESKEQIVNKIQRYACLRRLLKSNQDVDELIKAEFAREYSAIDDQEKLKIDASSLDTAKKQKLWDSYLEREQWKQQAFMASSAHLLNKGDRKQCELFADQFFEKVEHVEDSFHRDYFLNFFNNLNPSFLGREEDLAKFQALLTKYASTDKTLFVKLLKEEIDRLERNIAIKAATKAN